MPDKSIHRLSFLYEAATSAGGINGSYATGFQISKNISKKISKAMQLAGFNNKKNQRTPGARNRMLSLGTKIATAPVPMKQRHRKYFAMGNPSTPY